MRSVLCSVSVHVFAAHKQIANVGSFCLFQCFLLGGDAADSLITWNLR